MSGNHPREFKKRSLLIVSARDETISIVAMRIQIVGPQESIAEA
jgi:hypothetical protein